MPNLRPPVTTTEHARQYRQRIISALSAESGFEPLMTLYLTDNTPPAEIRRAKESGIVCGVKLYPAGATTNSDEGVTCLTCCMKTLEAMQSYGIPLLVHGEVTDPAVDVFDREAVFVDRVLIPLRRDLPGLKIVMEHVTTAVAAQYILHAEGHIGATVTPHHLLLNRNALFDGGLCPHRYCLPILKPEEDRRALVAIVCGGHPRFFAGTDSAPHAKTAKEAFCGAAGCYTALHAVELYAGVFDAQNALEYFDAFMSRNGAAFYGLPANRGCITLERRAWTVPGALPFGGETVVPLMAGKDLAWRLAVD
jgi:dihydroorotase